MIEETSSNQDQQKDSKPTEIVAEPVVEPTASTTTTPNIQPRSFPDHASGQEADKSTDRNEQHSQKEGEKSVTNFERKVAIIGIGLAVITATLFYVQLRVMTSQTQILASQSEGANAGALMDEMNTRTQLGIVQEQVGAAQKQANAAVREASVMQKQFEAADRPWIAVDVSINSPLTYDKNGAHIGFDISPKNIGRSTAQNIAVQVGLKTSTMGDDLSKIVKRICNGIAAQHGRWPLRYVLFPGDRFIQPTILGESSDEIDSYFRGQLPLEAGPVDLIPITLVGCIDYTYESSPRHHQTGIAIDVLMKDGRLILKSLTPLAPESLTLRLHPFGGHFAN